MTNTTEKKNARNARSNDALASYREALNAQFDARITEETRVAKSADVLSNKIKKIESYRANVAHDDVLRVMLAAKVDVAFITQRKRADAMCDIYRIMKVTKLARALHGVDKLEHYASAILRCAKAFATAELEFTEEEAKSACSLDVKSKDAAKEKICALHKYQSHVDASTVKSQYASSLFALVAFGVFTVKQNAARKDVYTLNDNAQTKALLEKIA